MGASLARPKLIAALTLVSLALIVPTGLWLRAAGGSYAASPAQAPSLRPARWPSDELTIANLGHATLLMNYFGVRVISDPTLFYRVGLSFGPFLTIGPHRFIAPPLKPAQLQQVNVILITHAHMDHLDIPSLKALPKSAVVIACTGCGDLIRPLGFTDVRELQWGQHTVVDGLEISAMGARHWGRRWPPWGRTYGFNSYVLTKGGHRMLLACDSAYTDLFGALRDNPPEVAAFSSAAYDPWIWNHADPEEVWAMFKQTGAHYLIPIHWGTFRQSKEPMDEPMRRLLAAAGSAASDIAIRQIGVAWTMPAAPPKALHAFAPGGGGSAATSHAATAGDSALIANRREPRAFHNQ